MPRARPVAVVSVILVVACGSNKRAPQVMTAPPPRTPAVVSPPEDYEREWHTWSPAALEGTDVNGRKPVYPVVLGEGCRDAGTVEKDRVLVCGRDAVRIGAKGAVFEPFRSGGGIDLKGELPERVFDYEGDVWVETRPREPRWPGSKNDPWDFFFVYRGSTHLFRDGKWTRFPTVEHPRRYQNGWLVFDLPRLETAVDRSAPGCADFACARLLPLFWHANVEKPPDFKALEGKIAWIHPYENEFDWAYHVDAKGAVHVVMRALDLATNKRVVGVLSWTEKTGARFQALPAIGGDAHFTATEETDAKDKSVQFVVTTWKPASTPASPSVEVKYILRTDATLKWTATKLPPPKPVKHDPYEGYEIPSDGPNVGGYSVNRGGMLLWGSEWVQEVGMAPQLSIGERGDLQFYFHFQGLYRSIQPAELFTLTDYWGDLHPWPQHAKDGCPHPFAVFDALDEEVYDAIIQAAAKKGLLALAPWGQLPPDWAHLELVEFRLFEPSLIVIGASVTPAEAKKLEKQMANVDGKRELRSWSGVGLGGDRYGEGIYCARPVAPRPFHPPY